MCDVTLTALFFRESIECIARAASKCPFRHFVIILVAPFITSVIIHFMLSIPYLYTYTLVFYLLYNQTHALLTL